MVRWILALSVLTAGSAAGQTRQAAPDPAARAFDLERRGQHVAAAEAYRVILTGRPNDIGALLGLERSLQQNGKVAEMLPEMKRALAGGQASAALYGLAVRVFTVAAQPDSARRVVERWTVLEPNSEAPFQEWGSAALGIRDRAQARAAYQAGRAKLGKDVLAGELAQLATVEGEYQTAVTEWLAAVAKTPGYKSAAVAVLAQVPSGGRPDVLRELEKAKSPSAERLAASLTIRWGDPVGGIRRLERSADLLGELLVPSLNDALDDLRGQTGREAGMARGVGLELLGAKVPSQATRYWLESAQAYADAGDQGSARRMLSKLAADPKSSPTMAASATSTLVAVLVAEGKVEEATRQFGQLKSVLTEDERLALQVKIAEGWIKAGKLDRAEQMVAQDSTVEGLGVRGRIRLYLGDLGGAAALLRAAGPFAGARETAVSRTTVLALLQMIDGDSLPVLGGALLKLERRDSAAAAEDLEKLAADLEPARGGAEILLLAGRVHAGLGEHAEAERVLRRVTTMEVPASAAAAGFELGKVLVALDRKPQAIEALEEVLVQFPGSAVAPQARRLLDVAKGAIPPV